MKASNLINKLQKMDIEYKINDVNGYNFDIVFEIKGVTFFAGFNNVSREIEDYCKEVGYDNANQEFRRVFYTNFNQLLKSIN